MYDVELINVNRCELNLSYYYTADGPSGYIWM